jgi:hypothetical protein
MSQKRTFVLELKNDQAITLEFSSIEATGDRLWQMFATTEALDIVQQLISTGSTVETRSARKTAPEKSVVAKKKK